MRLVRCRAVDAMFSICLCFCVQHSVNVIDKSRVVNCISSVFCVGKYCTTFWSPVRRMAMPSNVSFSCFSDLDWFPRCANRDQGTCYSNTTVYYGIHEHSECIPVDSGVTNLIHDRRSCVDFTLEVEANGSMCPLKREQARRETQQWVMRRIPTADSIVEIERKSRS